MKNLIILLIVSVTFIGCKTAYETISKTPPKDLMEKNLLAGRCKAEFPIDTSNSVIVFEKIPDSTGYFKGKADSLAKVKNKVVTEIKLRYRDTCTSAPLLYAQGFNEGFDLGYLECKTDGEAKMQRQLAKKEADCNTAHEAAMNKLKQENAYVNAECETGRELLKAEIEKQNKTIADKDNKIAKQRKVIWIESSILLLLLIAAIVYLYIKIKTGGIRSLLNKG